jgi:hypothetical protein
MWLRLLGFGPDPLGMLILIEDFMETKPARKRYETHLRRLMGWVRSLA